MARKTAKPADDDVRTDADESSKPTGKTATRKTTRTSRTRKSADAKADEGAEEKPKKPRKTTRRKKTEDDADQPKKTTSGKKTDDDAEEKPKRARAPRKRTRKDDTENAEEKPKAKRAPRKKTESGDTSNRKTESRSTRGRKSEKTSEKQEETRSEENTEQSPERKPEQKPERRTRTRTKAAEKPVAAESEEKLQMLINSTESEEVRIAILRDRKLEEFYIERSSHSTLVGNIYRGRVENVHPSLQAAFVNIGLEKNAFLHASESITPEEEKELMAGKFVSKPNKGRLRVQDVLKEGQEILVQVTRDGMRDKGPSVSMEVSLPGRFFVLTPTSPRLAFSRKIDDAEERARIREVMEKIDTPDNLGFIVRTAVKDNTKTDLRRDLTYLIRLWKAVAQRAKKSKAPSLIYQESDLVIRTIRDIFTPSIAQIVVDDAETYEKVRQFMDTAMPQYTDRIEHYQGNQTVFRRFDVERQIDEIHQREVQLPSGGSIVIEQTEAMFTIDVNSGSFTSRTNPEKTSTITNLEAAREIARQIRLRDMGGIIVIDFIDMRHMNNKRDVEKAFRDAFKNDRAKLTILRMSRFCLLEIARQKIRPAVRTLSYETCSSCNGSGLLKTPESISLSVMRDLRALLAREDIATIEVTADARVSRYLDKERKAIIDTLMETTGKVVHIITTKDDRSESAHIRGYSARGNAVVELDS
jgi:ribonuclease E